MRQWLSRISANQRPISKYYTTKSSSSPRCTPTMAHRRATRLPRPTSASRTWTGPPTRRPDRACCPLVWEGVRRSTSLGLMASRRLPTPSTHTNSSRSIARFSSKPLCVWPTHNVDEGRSLTISQYDLWPTTVRSPTTNDSTSQSNNSRVSMTLDQNLPSFQQRVYNLFSSYRNFSTFSNEAWIPSGQENEYDSLESLHDTIHTLSGTAGPHDVDPLLVFRPHILPPPLHG